MNSVQIIDALGGTAETARLCEVEMSAVSQWKTNGIPPARMMFLRLARPDVFLGAPEESAQKTAKTISE